MKKYILFLVIFLFVLSFNSDTTSNCSVPSVTLGQKEVMIVKDQELKLKPKFSSTDARKKKCIWISSDTDVATVNKGMIKTRKAGNTIIRLQAEDGSFSDSLQLTVAIAHENHLVYTKKINGVSQLFAQDTALPLNEIQITHSSEDNTELDITGDEIKYCRKNHMYLQKMGEFAEYTTTPIRRISCWGDSMTAGTGGYGATYPDALAKLSGLEIDNNGVGGQSSTSIAIRQGGIPLYLSVRNDTIPSSGKIAVVRRSGIPITNQGDNYLNGWLSGIYGKLVSDKEGVYTFTRAVEGEKTPCPEGSEFVVDNGNQNSQICIFWYGRNNYMDVQTVLRDIEASVSTLKPLNKQFIILSVCNGNYGSKEIKGGEGYNKIIAINEALKAKYPKSYIDIRKMLVNHYNPTDPSDVANHLNDVVPRSLRHDNIHLNAKGYNIVAKAIYERMKAMGWAY